MASKKKTSLGFCTGCGSNLSKKSEICPECGKRANELNFLDDFTEKDIAYITETRREERYMYRQSAKARFKPLNDNIEEINTRPRLSTQEMIEMARKNNWEGKGTATDPIIIKESDVFPEDFWLEGSKLYIDVINCKFNIIRIKQCQNLVFEDCSFKQITLAGSAIIQFNSSSFVLLDIAASTIITINKCSIGNVSTVACSKIEFKECRIHDKGMELLSSKSYLKISLLSLILGISSILSLSLLSLLR